MSDLPSLSRIVDADHPWLGLASFTPATQQYFFGRDAEISEIYLRTRENPLTILYGQSGLGKTSLLGAGLIPKLTIEHCRPLLLRLRFEKVDPPLTDQLHAALAPLFAGAGAAAPGHGPETLWEKLHHVRLRPLGMETAPPVLIFDQFEEIFTLGQRAGRQEEVRAFFTQLADVIENRPPAAFTRRFQEDRRLVRDYDLAPSPLRVVITLREDYLSHLEAWKRLLPSLMRNRMALHLLNGPQALEAVYRPGQMEGRHLVDEETAARIVRFVANRAPDVPLEEIGAVPPLLSLVCDELNAERLEQNRPQLTTERVSLDAGATGEDEDDLEARSRVILARFYQRSFAGFPAGVRHFVEDRMIDTAGHRCPVSRDDALAAFTRAGSTDPDADLLALVNSRLLSTEERAGVQWFEITHDVLAPIVQRSRDERLQHEAAAEARRKLAEEAAKQRKSRLLASLMTVLTLLALAGAWFGWRKAGAATAAAAEANRQKQEADHQRSAATRNEALAKAEAARAESALAESLSRLDRATLEEGKTWLERARTAEGNKDPLTAQFLAARAVGFRGFGWEQASPDWQAKFPPLLGSPLAHDPAAETERLTEQKAVVDFSVSLAPAAVPVWVRGHSEAVLSVAYSPDGSRLASGSGDKTVKLWDTAKGKELATLAGHSGDVRSVSFSPDGRRLASGAEDKTVKLWDTTKGKELATLAGHSDSVLSVAFSPDGSRLASGSGPFIGAGTVKLWDTATGKELATLAGHSGDIRSVALSPDGRRLASGSADRTVKVWDTATGKELATLAGHWDWVTSVAFSLDGRRLASGSDDNTMKLWDTATGKELPGKPDFALVSRGAARSADGRLAAEREGAIIRLTQTTPRLPNLLHFLQHGLLDLEGRNLVWKQDIPLDTLNAVPPMHYRDDALERLADPKLTPEGYAVLRLQLCAKGNQWRAALAVWRQLVGETPALAESAPARRELLTLAAATLQKLAQAQKPSAPVELCGVLTENLRAEDFADTRVSLPLAEAAWAVLAKWAVFTPPLPADVREAFRAHLLKTAPQSWREAVPGL